MKEEVKEKLTVMYNNLMEKPNMLFDIFKDFGQKELSKNKIVDENEQYVLFEIDEGIYQLVADDQVIGETEKNNICDALESIKSQKVKLDF